MYSILPFNFQDHQLINMLLAPNFSKNTYTYQNLIITYRLLVIYKVLSMNQLSPPIFLACFHTVSREIIRSWTEVMWSKKRRENQKCKNRCSPHVSTETWFEYVESSTKNQAKIKLRIRMQNFKNYLSISLSIDFVAKRPLTNKNVSTLPSPNPWTNGAKKLFKKNSAYLGSRRGNQNRDETEWIKMMPKYEIAFIPVRYAKTSADPLRLVSQSSLKFLTREKYAQTFLSFSWAVRSTIVEIITIRKIKPKHDLHE